MKIAFLAAGAAGMYCGSCLRDNAVARALKALGEEITLVPLYTPLRVDGRDESVDRIFYGGINVYLQQKSAFFRHTPRFLDALLDSEALINFSTRFAGMTRPEDLGELTLSTLRGDEGNQAKELTRLAKWLADDLKPDIVNLPNSMFSGAIREISKRTGAKIIVSLTGEDLFLEGMIEPFKSEALAVLRERIAEADRLIAISSYYADFMSEYLHVPRAKISVVPLGIAHETYGRKVSRHTDPFTVGYLARIAPEKGFHLLCDAVHILRGMPGGEKVRLHAAGWLGAGDRDYYEQTRAKIGERGWIDHFHYAGEVDFKQKLAFLDGLSVLSVPTVYHDPKGLFVLEALAHGLPVVQPDHGAFPEVIRATGGGTLFESGNADALARQLHEMMADRESADRYALHGQQVVRRKFGERDMALATRAVYEKVLTEGGAA